MTITKAFLLPLNSYLENLYVEPNPNKYGKAPPKGCSGPRLFNKSHMSCSPDLNHVSISVLVEGERSHEHLVRVAERPSFGYDTLKTRLR